MARPVKGKWIVKQLPKTASVTFTNGDLVQMTSGYVATATAQSTENHGIILTAVTSGDSDFASATKVPVAVPAEPSAEFECTVTGTLATTSIGEGYDLSTAGLVNVAGTTYKVALCTGYISTAKGRFILSGNAAYTHKQ
uniref:Head decoration protein n=1 Tax=viral metagenome TaxID=1070528 RepID=A0A6M3IL45_9ZZZZ